MKINLEGKESLIDLKIEEALSNIDILLYHQCIKNSSDSEIAEIRVTAELIYKDKILSSSSTYIQIYK